MTLRNSFNLGARRTMLKGREISAIPAVIEALLFGGLITLVGVLTYLRV